MRSSPLLRPDDTLNTTSGGRLLLSLAARQKVRIVFGMIYSTLWMVTQALIPAAVGRTIDTGISRHDSGELVRWSLVVLALGVVRALSSIGGYRILLISRAMAGYYTNQAVTRHATRLGSSLPGLIADGEVVAIGTSDIGGIGMAVALSGRLVGSVLAVAIVALIMLKTSVPLGLLVLVGVPVMTSLTSWLLRKLEERQDHYRDLQGGLTGRAMDITAGLRVLRGIGGEPMFARNFRGESEKLREADVAVTRVEADLYATRVLIPGVLITVVTFVAARYALDTRLTVGQLVAFYGYASFLELPLSMALEGIQSIPGSMVAARRVVRLLNLEPRLQDSPGAPGTAGDTTPGDLLDPVSGLTIPAGSFYAVACADPDDAVALSRRLTRFDDGTGDSALIGGRPLASIPLPELRSRILLAGNNDRLFPGTLRDGLDPAGRAGEAELNAALDTASAQDIISELPAGLESTIADNGREFSGGQAQRLRLARALLNGSEVTVLVEPTNAVDAHTESRVAQNLAGLHAPAPEESAAAPGSAAGASGSGGKPRTTVVFTVSPLILSQAQRVAFVADGRVVASDTHHELLTHSPAYRAVVTRDDADVEVDA